MKGFSQLRVKSAVKARNLIDLSADHLTTSQFGQIQPLKVIETIPGGEYPINASYFSRLAPLVEPTYGKFKFNTLIGFVPYCQIAYDADAWLVGKTSWEGQTPLHRYFTIDILQYFVRTHCCTTTGATASNSDYTYTDSSGVVKYNLFTSVGKYWIKVLNSLGYAVPQGVDLQSTSSWYSNVRTYKLSAYPLLAFFKLYNDYMTQSQRFNTSVLSDLLLKIKYNKTVTGFNPSTGEVSTAAIKAMFDWLYLNYENDYFTSAWMNPNTPLASSESVNLAFVPENAGDAVGNTTGDNFLMTAVQSGTTYLGQRSLDFLQRFDNWVRRNSYSGSRSVQQMFSRFGIKSDDYKSHYAHVLKVDSFPVQVGDITSTSDTSGASLGDYAGKGIMSGDNSVSYKASDVGLLIVLGWYSVVPMNPYGFDRMVLRNQPFDYYTPEFDGLGADAISVMEYFENPIGSGSTLGTDVFGFTERYNSYRYGRDNITGDFRDMHFASGDMNAWHTGRNMTAIRAGGQLVAQSSSVNTMPQYGSEYNRIFNVTNGSVDTFFLTCHFDIKATLPILNLNQVVRLGEGDTILPRNGDVIS